MTLRRVRGGKNGVTLQHLEKLYASAATDETGRTWLRSVAADYAKMPYVPKHAANGSHGTGGMCGRCETAFIDVSPAPPPDINA